MQGTVLLITFSFNKKVPSQTLETN